jgi:hypothetical protein
MPRKVTKVWKQKDGKKIRICDMTDKHLVNSLNLVERKILEYRIEAIWSEANEFCDLGVVIDDARETLEGARQTFNRISELINKIPPGEGAELYESLLKEYNRRGLACLIGPRE